MSTVTDAPNGVNQRIGANVRALRAEQGLTLSELAAASGVSRSGLSLIERAESSPTASVLERIATALAVPLESLFKLRGEEPRPLVRRTDQPVWRDPGSGYLRRSVSPIDTASPIEIIEVTFPAGARVTFDNGNRSRVTHQCLWVLEGTIEFTLGAATERLATGDCFAMQLDQPTSFHNPTHRSARYAVILASR
jgi:transcriptional regulator with XRE-family HTH domain